ncbi:MULTISPECIES: hydroxyacylglutathione hydrolase [Providencia]|uniref:hydroxyacylglutathione hydrolase n=1 Tax=Providencia TaxID=586 RepID=UPI0018E4B8B6|nr:MULTISPECIES: hydroxyacylglutathione hydrolase [Providencia]EJD6378739.1 hydroxyacylglutathione hydrolase [Providencia rettgeri]EJF7713606.1 hydroxyacylglutathione hydrolase [Providencia rettgeri]ELR5115890.1 hydroxyacylglutathione hydrolase [Providencia rettgeri]MBI6203073.1 hydroxyacylglutathione hydrolase [Providencia rettgeri]MCG5281523.1 hydroxyacylglutathione hydrolase [Providencia rettgeri]
MELIRVPALNDNYIWVLVDGHQQCIIVDPAEAEPVLEIITAKQLTPVAILLTHHHNDHTGGVKGILSKFTTLPVFGPKETQSKGATEIVENGDKVIINEFNLQVIALSGHTSEHIGFYQAPYLFCGDTLFSAGCGRIFEGTPEQMFESIQKIAELPDETLICCAHEYTLSNLKFAHHVWPENEAITQYLQKITQIRDKHQPTVPTTLKKEKKINIFLQCDNLQLQKKLDINVQNPPLRAVFTLLRQLKDQY